MNSCTARRQRLETHPNPEWFSSIGGAVRWYRASFNCNPHTKNKNVNNISRKTGEMENVNNNWNSVETA